jgi:hypothetical protein
MNHWQACLRRERTRERALPGPGHPRDEDAATNGTRCVFHQAQCRRSGAQIARSRALAARTDRCSYERGYGCEADQRVNRSLPRLLCLTRVRTVANPPENIKAASRCPVASQINKAMAPPANTAHIIGRRCSEYVARTFADRIASNTHASCPTIALAASARSADMARVRCALRVRTPLVTTMRCPDTFRTSGRRIARR